MSLAEPIPLRFQIGARVLWSVPRQMVFVPLSLEDGLAGTVPGLPPLGRADGYSVTSLPADGAAALTKAHPALIAFVRQRYTRYYIDLRGGFDAWWAGLSGNTRSGLKRKAKKLGALDVRRYRTPDEMLEFHGVARDISARTYQEKLLDAGLPDTPEFRAQMLADAAAGHAWGWLLYVEGVPAAYLYCPVRGQTALYEYVGHCPSAAHLSVGTLLQVEALRDLFASESVDMFDFTEGEGQHKQSLSTAGIAALDILLLRKTPFNRAALTALATFDRTVAAAKGLVERHGLGRLAKGVRRGG